MTTARTTTPSDLRVPTSYKARYERELNRRLHLEGRVAALEVERDALRYRLGQAQKPESKEALQQRQAYLGVGA